MAPQICYALVARGTVVLAEHSNVTGNANLVAMRILDKLPAPPPAVASATPDDASSHAADARVSYCQDAHLFHCLVAGGLTFMCVADEAMGRRVPFGFLEDCRDRFGALYGSAAQQAVAYEYNTEFSRILQQRMVYFNSDPGADAISRVRGELSEVKNVMVENIEKVLERGERLELLVDKTDHLQHESLAFRREARRLKHRMWWRNARAMGLMGGAVLLVLYIAVCMICSPTFQC